VREYDIFLPLLYNDGSAVEPGTFENLKRLQLDELGGVTYFPQPAEGLWRMGEVVYHDEIVIYRVLSEKPRKARRFLSQLKKALKPPFQQEEILIVERDVETL
jgi:hypothetical protein